MAKIRSTVNPEKRYELYCKLVGMLAITKDVNRIIDEIVKLGWKP